jgi:hypothetical protein
MKSFPIVFLGGGLIAGYAAKEFAMQSGKKRELANVTAKQLSDWWLKKKTLCAALIMNHSEEKRAIAPCWILRRPLLDTKALVKARNLKSLNTTFGRPENL